METKPTICLMLKAPRAGFVKTRLAREVGAEEAARIYRLLVEHQMEQLPKNWPVEVHFAPSHMFNEMKCWLGEKPVYHPQSEGDLGERLTAAMNGAFQRGAKSLIFLGGDCPGVTLDHLETVERQLSEYDVVIGPAKDGGYYLLGLNSPCDHMFENIEWSTSLVFSQTMQRSEDLSLKAFTLDVLVDVDDLSSWHERHPDEASRWQERVGKDHVGVFRQSLPKR